MIKVGDIITSTASANVYNHTCVGWVGKVIWTEGKEIGVKTLDLLPEHHLYPNRESFIGCNNIVDSKHFKLYKPQIKLNSPHYVGKFSNARGI